MREYKQFAISLSKVLSALLLVCSPILFFNMVVDPYGIFFNAYKHIRSEPNKRYMKIHFLTTHPDKFDSFIFGSSRANFINPDNIPNSVYYNMTYSIGMPSAHYEDIQELLKSGVHIKNLLIGIDYISLIEDHEVMENDLLRKKFPVSVPEKIRFYKSYLLNMPDRNFVKLAFMHNSIDRSTMLKQGISLCPSEDSAIDANPVMHLSKITLQTPNTANTPNPDISNNLNEIKKIVQIAKVNHINLRFYINPTQSCTYLNLNLDYYFDALKRLAKITDYCDFSGLNSIAIDNMNYYDASHFRTKIGDLMLAKIFKNPDVVIPDDFGRFVNQKNIWDQIRFHKALLKEYFDATILEPDKSQPLKLSNLIKMPVRPVFAIEHINEKKIGVIHHPIRISTPWIKIKGWVINPFHEQKIADVFVQIGDQIFRTNCVSEQIENKASPHIGSPLKTDWVLSIPTSHVEPNVQAVRLIVVSADRTKYAISDTSFEFNVLRDKKPLHPNRIKEQSNRVLYSVDLINGVDAHGFSFVTDESFLRIEGWAADEASHTPCGGVIVSIDEKKYLSQFVFDRPDITNWTVNSGENNFGWGICLPISDLPKGEHEIAFKFLNQDQTTYYSPSQKIIFQKRDLQAFNFFKGLNQSPEKTLFSIDLMNQTVISTMKEPMVISGRVLKIEGWAVDHPSHKPASDVIVEIDGKQFQTSYGLKRADVAKGFSNELYENSGWRIELPTKFLGNGMHTLTIKIVSNDKKSYYVAEKSIIFFVR